ncbi:MAG: Zinc/Iron permease [Parcubacteria group bacterium Gr01-1014_8]|nr:MAG: Zinc/Iron permease [Parcubacteria group bacterium Gr01-1014_8]
MDFSAASAAFLASLLVMLISLIGVIFSAGKLGQWMQRYLTYLATFSAGVFVLVAFDLASEAVRAGGWVVAVISVLIGATLMEGIHYIFPTKHHHHDVDNSHTHTPIEGRSVLFSDALHNIGDGILLVGAFETNWYIGLAATLGVVLHETVQEVSEYFVLRGAGYSNKGALTRSFLVSSTILIGFFLASTLSSVTWIVALFSGIAAGGFMSVVLHDLLPHALASVRSNGGTYMHILAGLVGAGLMLGIQTALPEEEPMDPSRVMEETEQLPEINEPLVPSAPSKAAPKANRSTNSTVGTPSIVEATTTSAEGTGGTPASEPSVSEPALSTDGQSVDTGGIPRAR